MSGLMAFVLAALLVASRWLVICGLVTLPVTFPAVLVLGGDELDDPLVSACHVMSLPMARNHHFPACTLPVISRTSLRPRFCMKSRRPAITCKGVCGS
jgi:hypothetical protein